MTGNKWPNRQATAPEIIRVYPHWEQHGDNWDESNCHIAEDWGLDGGSQKAKEFMYTRTDIAEGRLDDLEDAIAALRKERDALRARIEDAQVVHDVTGKLGFVGRDVALVALGDDE